MARYSLTAGLFSLDEKGETRDLAATLEAIAAAGFGEVELMAEGAEVGETGGPRYGTLPRSPGADRGSIRTRSTHR